MSGAQFAKFANDLLRASTDIDVMGALAAERVGKGALATAKSVAPSDSGDLDASLKFRREGSTAIISTNLYYARFQEFGTSVMAPNPFMGVAVDIWAPQLVAEVEFIRDKVIKDLG